MVNTSHKFAIYNPNIEIQEVIPFVTPHTPSQYQYAQYVIIDIFGDRAEILQIHFVYLIWISAIIW